TSSIAIVAVTRRRTRGSPRPAAPTSSAPIRPNTSAAATGNERLYCASSVVRGIAHCEPRSTASRKLSIAMVATSSALKPCAGGDFVAEDERRNELAAVHFGGNVSRLRAVDEREDRRQHGGSRVTLGEHVSIVAVQRVDRRRPGECGAGNAGATAVEQHARVALGTAHLSRRIRIDDSRGARPTCRGADSNQV